MEEIPHRKHRATTMVQFPGMAADYGPAEMALGATLEDFPANNSISVAWLAEPVQACRDLNVPFGFLLTNRELVIFHLITIEDKPLIANRGGNGATALGSAQLTFGPPHGRTGGIIITAACRAHSGG
ncbi:hypothetical protein F4680DRAFT_452468 [Xylaria scruposa]|nr:hypothetical protein F4680DRAFT_452468 [Xylaria scruposa]